MKHMKEWTKFVGDIIRSTPRGMLFTLEKGMKRRRRALIDARGGAIRW